MIYTGSLGPYRNQWPVFGSRINPDHPLAISILNLYMCNEARGLVVHDSVRNLDLPLINYSTNPSWFTGPSGGGILSNTLNTAAQTTLPRRLFWKWPLTIACALRFGSVIANSRIWGYHTTNTTTAPFTAITFYHNSSTSVGVLFTTGGASNNGLTTTASLSQGVDYVLSMTVTPTKWRWYINGVPFNGGSQASGNPSWTANALIFLAGSPYFSSTANVQPMYWAATWTREFSDKEHALLGSSIYYISNLFQPQIDYSSLYQRIASGQISPARARVLLGNSPFTLGQAGLLRR